MLHNSTLGVAVNSVRDPALTRVNCNVQLELWRKSHCMHVVGATHVTESSPNMRIYGFAAIDSWLWSDAPGGDAKRSHTEPLSAHHVDDRKRIPPCPHPYANMEYPCVCRSTRGQ